MSNCKEVIEKLEKAPDLKTNPKRLKDYIEMGQNIFLTENNFEEGKRVCENGRDIALSVVRKNKLFYEEYLLALKYLARYFRDFDSYLIFVEHKREPKSQFYLPRRQVLRKLGIIQALQDLLDDKLDILSISMSMGTGKGQRENAKILTPSGFKRFGDIKVGDKVISGTGKVSEVLGVYPKPSMPIYELTFNDGSKVQCSQDHIWHVQTRYDRNRGQYRDIETKDMLDKVKCEKNNYTNYSIDYVPVIDCFEEKKLLLDPYLMGVILGDGGLTNDSVIITLPDEEIKNEVEKRLPKECVLQYSDRFDYRIKRKEYRNRWVRNEVVYALEKYDLMKKHSYEKHIPKDYLYSSYNDRLELLRGLLDTDGYAWEHGIEYTTTSKQLALDVKELVCSLGGYCSIAEKKKSGYKKDGEFIECRQAYRLVIQFSANQPNPFKLSRKANLYKPKRPVLKRFITSIEYVGEEKTSCIYISDPSHLYITDDYIITHNTTVEEYFVSYYMGLYPEKYNLYSSHTNAITDMFYRAVWSIVSTEEYAWNEVFPSIKIESKSDKDQYINLGQFKPFKTLACKSIGSATAGVTRANGLLCCDDLIEGKEEAFSKERLEKKYETYAIDLVTRKMEGCKELHICTRWSVHDIIGHLIANNEDNPRARFIAIDCYDENGESVFNYKINGFTTEYFHSLEQTMDNISFQCMCRSKPMEREGLLYREDELNYYLGGLPANEDGTTKEADAILGVCDTKDTGTDYNCLLVGFKYGNKVYLEDVVYDNGSPYVLDELNANCLVRNNVQMCQFESNKEGSRTGNEVQKLIEEKGGRCTITKKYTTTNKETKILVNSDWVKKHVIFKDKSEQSEMYNKFMNDACSYVQLGKNKHDDSVDALAMLALFIQSFEGSQVEIVSRASLGF